MSEPTVDPNTTKDPQVGWMEWASRTTAIVAVLAALSSGQWGASNLQAILEQGKVNDGWAYYQSKSIKQHSAEDIGALARAMKNGSPGSEATLEQLATTLAAEAAHEQADKAKQETAVRDYENARDRMVERGFWFQISFALLQLAVVLSTVATAAKRKAPWIIAILFGLLGLAILFNGLHPIVPAPKAWYHGTSEQMENNVDKVKATH